MINYKSSPAACAPFFGSGLTLLIRNKKLKSERLCAHQLCLKFAAKNRSQMRVLHGMLILRNNCFNHFD